MQQIHGTWREGLILALTAIAMVPALACGERAPATDAERLERGRAIVDRMSTTLGKASAFTVTSDEQREVNRPDGKTQNLSIKRQIVVRRPDRLYVRSTGDHDNEAYYDGVGLTLVMHGQKVFGQARMPETLDRTLDAINERYGVPIPVADFLYTSPAKALLTEKTTGGWVAREDVGGRPQDHLTFKDTGMTYDLWVAASGDPLPIRAVIQPTNDKRLRRLDVTFRDWNLSPTIENTRFDPTVPKDYEGIAVLQRAAVLRNAQESASPAEGSAPKR